MVKHKVSFASQFQQLHLSFRAYYVLDCAYKITVFRTRGTSFSLSPFSVAFYLEVDEARNTGASSVRKERVARRSGNEARASERRSS